MKAFYVWTVASGQNTREYLVLTAPIHYRGSIDMMLHFAKSFQMKQTHLLWTKGTISQNVIFGWTYIKWQKKMFGICLIFIDFFTSWLFDCFDNLEYFIIWWLCNNHPLYRGGLKTLTCYIFQPQTFSIPSAWCASGKASTLKCVDRDKTPIQKFLLHTHRPSRLVNHSVFCSFFLWI